MNGVQKTLYIPLYGKAQVRKKGLLLRDPKAEEIWEKEGFPIRGKSKSKWLCYNMAMRARVYDDWTRKMLREHPDATVLHIGCGLDSRVLRVETPRALWIDCDFPDVLAVRRTYYAENAAYRMQSVDASCANDLRRLPDAPTYVVVLEGVSMYLTNAQLRQMLCILRGKCREMHMLLDVYTAFGAKASRLKNPVHDVGVSTLYGVDDLGALCEGTGLRVTAELPFPPAALADELPPRERRFFKMMFSERVYRKITRVFECTGV